MKEKATFVSLTFIPEGVRIIQKGENVLTSRSIRSETENSYIVNIPPRLYLTVRAGSYGLITEEILEEIKFFGYGEVNAENVTSLKKIIEKTEIFVEHGMICNMDSILVNLSR